MTRPVILYDNRFDDGPLSGTTPAVGFDRENLTDWRTYSFYKPNPTIGAASVTVDCGKAKPADYGLVWGHNLATLGMRAELRASDDGFVASNVFMERIYPTDDRPFALYIPSASWRHWRWAFHRNNWLAWSEAFDNAVWTDPLAFWSVVANAEADPNGDLTADVITVAPAATQALVRQILSKEPTSGSMAFSVWAKVISGVLTDFRVDYGDSVSQDLLPQMQAGQWVRVTAPVLANTTANNWLDLRLTFAAANGQIALWGAQLENTGTVNAYYKREEFGTLEPIVAIAAIGEMLEMPATLDEGFDPTKREPRGRLSRSVEGHPLGRAVTYEAWSENLKFPNLSWDFLRDTWVPAWKAHLRGTPFVLSWDRVGKPEELHLISAPRGYDSPHKAGQIATLTLPVEGLAL